MGYNDFLLFFMHKNDIIQNPYNIILEAAISMLFTKSLRPNNLKNAKEPMFIE